MKCFNIVHLVALSVNDLKVFSSGKFLVLFLEMSFYFFLFSSFSSPSETPICWLLEIWSCYSNFLIFFILPFLHLFVLFPEISSSSNCYWIFKFLSQYFPSSVYLSYFLFIFYLERNILLVLDVFNVSKISLGPE